MVTLQNLDFLICFSCYIPTKTVYIYLSLELRELEAKLKSAYVNKERAAQIAEQEAMKTERMVSTFYVSRQQQCNNKYYDKTSACAFRLKPVLCFSFYRD